MPDTKAGARRIPLPEAAKAVLDSVESAEGNLYIIAGKLAGSHATDLQYPWRRFRDRAELPEVRIHDLRHTHASNAVSGGMPIQMVGELLGHNQIQTTMRYGHLADDLVNRAAKENAGRLNDAAMSLNTLSKNLLRVVR